MEDEKEYKNGFNASFLLAEHEPGLLEKLSKNVIPTSTYLEGFVDGKQQYYLEKQRHNLSELKSLRHRHKDKEEKELD